MKTLLFILTLSFLSNLLGQTSIYDFSVKTIDNKPYNFKELNGKKMMIVNVTSKFSYTPQYEKLEALYQKYKDDHFIILGFPANIFFNQEPGMPEEIIAYCTCKYNVTFPIIEKISVKDKDIHPLYLCLSDKSLNFKINASTQWNFQKLLIDEQGQIALVIPPSESPMSERIIQWIENKQ